MRDLTPRQIQILKLIIEEYIETAEPVGSETLEKKFHLGVSPATLRNEMAELVKKGYLKQPHVSAGRMPTPMALKFYVRELMKPKELSVADEVAVKEKIWDYRDEIDRLVREATRVLAEKTKLLALSTINEDDLYFCGAANILDNPEFYDIDLTRTLLAMLDERDYWFSLFDRALEGEDLIHILIGSELGSSFLEPCGFIYTDYEIGRKKGTIGVIGPARLDFSYVVPIVEYLGGLISEVGRG